MKIDKIVQAIDKLMVTRIPWRVTWNYTYTVRLIKQIQSFYYQINFAGGQDTGEEYCNIDPVCIKEGVTYYSNGADGKNGQI